MLNLCMDVKNLRHLEAEDERYVSHLDDATLRKAELELNEIAADRIAAVRSFRRWIVEQPHLVWIPLDTITLLSFLRSAKFSQMRARELLEGHIQIRQEAPTWFQDVDTHEEGIQLVLDAGISVPLPRRDPEGHLILLQRPGAVDPLYKSGYSRLHNFRTGMILNIHGNRSEMTQVNGTIFLLDFSAVTSKHIRSMMSSSEIQKFQKKWQKNTPGRYKKFIIYNPGSFLETLLSFTKAFMSKKHRERLVVCDTAESLYKHVSMELLPVEYLPDDYTGPNAGSLQSLLDDFKAEITSEAMRKLFLEHTSSICSIDDTKRVPDDESIDYHYRKLDVM